MRDSGSSASPGDEHLQVIHAFFHAFARGDADGLGRCYHPDVSFGDPVFLEIEGRERVVGMWRMMLERSHGVEVSARDIEAGKHSGTAHWTARYVFAPTGRRVVNEIEALFRFEEGLIVRHHDEFDFRHWSKMAIGRPTGVLLGWTPMLRRRLRDQARDRLEDYLRSNSSISG